MGIEGRILKLAGKEKTQVSPNCCTWDRSSDWVWGGERRKSAVWGAAQQFRHKRTGVSGKIAEGSFKNRDFLLLNFNLFALLQGKSFLHFPQNVSKGLIRFERGWCESIKGRENQRTFTSGWEEGPHALEREGWLTNSRTRGDHKNVNSSVKV